MGLNSTGNPALAGVLRTHRERRGLSQNALAVAVGVHTSTVWKVEAGTRSMGIRSIDRLAKELGPVFEAEAKAAVLNHGH